MNEPDKETINSNDVGSLEDVLGKDDSLFHANEEKQVDLTGTQDDLVGHQDQTNHELHVAENASPEDFGKDEAEGENTVTENMKDIDPDSGTQDDPANDHRLSTVKPKKDIPEEYVIEYLYNPSARTIICL